MEWSGVCTLHQVLNVFRTHLLGSLERVLIIFKCHGLIKFVVFFEGQICAVPKLDYPKLPVCTMESTYSHVYKDYFTLNFKYLNWLNVLVVKCT